MTTRRTLADLLPNTLYAVQMRALGDNGAVSEWSRKFTFLTLQDTILPTTPTGVTWVASGDSFHGEWNAVVENTLGEPITITRYEVELTGGATTRIVSVAPTTGAKNTYDLSYEQNRALFGTPQSSVAMRVRAVDNKDLKSEWSALITVANSVPDAPSDLNVTAISGGLSIKWTPSPSDDVVGYNVYVGTAPNPTVNVAFTTSNPYVFSTLTFEEHWVRIKAVDKFGLESSYSNQDSATPLSPFEFDNEAPAAPVWTSITISNDSTGSVGLQQYATLVWTHPGDANLAGFNIRYKVQGTSDWQALNVDPDERTIRVVLPIPLEDYDFEIRAYDAFALRSVWVAAPGNAETTYPPPTLIHSIKIGGGGFIESSSFGSGVGFRIDEDSITVHDGDINGQAIKTGVIQSNQFAVDADGNVTTEPAWWIDLEGDATLGNARVKGSLVIGEATEDFPSVAQSWNYTPGDENILGIGWQLRSDGTGALLSLDANTIDGDAIKANTLDVNVISGGTLGPDATIELEGSIVAIGDLGEEVKFGEAGFSVYGPTETRITSYNIATEIVTITTADPHGYIVGADVTIKGVSDVIDGDHIIETVTETTYTFTLAGAADTSGSVAVSDGISQGRDWTGVRTGANYINFPTNSENPNIISGQLTTDTMTITGGATFRGVSGIERGAQLVINSTVLAPKSAPSISMHYNQLQISGVGQSSIFGATRGHNGNIFICTRSQSGRFTIQKVHELNNEGQQVAIHRDVSTGFYNYARGITYSPTYDRYYLLVSEEFGVTGDGGKAFKIKTFDTSWNEIGSVSVESWLSEAPSLGYRTIGYDYDNNRVLLVSKANATANLVVKSYNLSATGTLTGGIASTVTLTSTSSSQHPAFIAKGNFDYGTILAPDGIQRFVYKDRVTTKTGQTAVNTHWYVADATTGGIRFNDLWQGPPNESVYGGFWDPVAEKFYGINPSSQVLEFQPQDYMWDTSDAASYDRYIAYTWRDATGSTEADFHETDLSPIAKITMRKRAGLQVTINPIPKGAGGPNDPTQARIYMYEQGYNPTVAGAPLEGWMHRETIVHPSTTIKLPPFYVETLDTPPYPNEFLSITNEPGMISSATGNSFWKGDDTARFYSLELRSGADVNAGANNKAPLRIGAQDGTELRLDGNEIQSVTSSTSGVGGQLILNQGGGAVVVGKSSRGIKCIRMGVHTGNSNGSGQTTTNHSMTVAPDVVVAIPLGAGVARACIHVASQATSTEFTIEHRKISDGTLVTSDTADFNWIAIAYS